jgi:hypothetical protein
MKVLKCRQSLDGHYDFGRNPHTSWSLHNSDHALLKSGTYDPYET